MCCIPPPQYWLNMWSPIWAWIWMLVFDRSVDPPPIPFNLPMFLPPSLPPLSHPSLLPSSSPLDHPDADREQCATEGPAGWGSSWPWGRGTWWRWGNRRPLGSGWDARWSGWIWARRGPTGAFGALLGHPPLPPSPEGTPGLLNVRARGGPRPHGPRSPSPGLPSAPPAAPQHSQRKLERPCPLSTHHLRLGGSDCLSLAWLNRWWSDPDLYISPPLLSPCISVLSPSLSKDPVVHEPIFKGSFVMVQKDLLYWALKLHKWWSAYVWPEGERWERKTTKKDCFLCSAAWQKPLIHCCIACSAHFDLFKPLWRLCCWTVA